MKPITNFCLVSCFLLPTTGAFTSLQNVPTFKKDPIHKKSPSALMVGARIEPVTTSMPRPISNKPFELGSGSYIIGLFASCSVAYTSALNCLAFSPVLALSSYLIALSVVPSFKDSIDIPNDAFARIFGAHLFSATAIPQLTSMLLPLFSTKKQITTLIFSMALMMVGSIAEIQAHFKDRWVFDKGCNAADGNENVIFSVCLNGVFSFLAAAFNPTVQNLALACLPPLFLVAVNWKMPWKQAKAFVYGSQTVAAGLANAIFIAKLKSWWPLLYFVQAFNIIRNGKLILETNNQNLHMMPSVYGWFSYTMPFALSLCPSTRAASLPVVFAVSLLTIYGSNRLEQQISKHLPLVAGSS